MDQRLPNGPGWVTSACTLGDLPKCWQRWCDVLKATFCFPKIIPQSGKSSAVQARGREEHLKAKRASAADRAIPLLLSIPTSEFQLQGQGMTKVLPFKARVLGNLVSQGTLQSSTLSRKTGVEKTSPCLSSQWTHYTPPQPTNLGLSQSWAPCWAPKLMLKAHLFCSPV